MMRLAYGLMFLCSSSFASDIVVKAALIFGQGTRTPSAMVGWYEGNYAPSERPWVIRAPQIMTLDAFETFTARAGERAPIQAVGNPLSSDTDFTYICEKFGMTLVEVVTTPQTSTFATKKVVSKLTLGSDLDLEQIQDSATGEIVESFSCITR